MQAKQNAPDLLININNGGGYLTPVCLYSQTSSESFSFLADVFIICSYSIRSAAGMQNLFFTRIKIAASCRADEENAPLRRTWPYNVRASSVAPRHLRALRDDFPPRREIAVQRILLSRYSETSPSNVRASSVVPRHLRALRDDFPPQREIPAQRILLFRRTGKHLPLCYDHSMV